MEGEDDEYLEILDDDDSPSLESPPPLTPITTVSKLEQLKKDLEGYKINESFKSLADYQIVIKMVETLKAFQEQTKSDIETLLRLKTMALEVPVKFVDDLVNERLEPFPKRQKIPSLPTVNFQKYQKIKLPPPPRPRKETTTEKVSSPPQGGSSPEKEISSPSSNEHENSSQNSPNDKLRVGEKIRGREYTPQKPPSFNRLWTEEENEKLEELLLKYPPEPVAAHRWSKIARALGTRTPKQVASRTQKRDQKLMKALLPAAVLEANKKKRKRKKTEGEDEKSTGSSASSDYYKPPPVIMPDEDRDLHKELSRVDPSLRNTEDYQELVKLMKLKNENVNKKK